MASSRTVAEVEVVRSGVHRDRLYDRPLRRMPSGASGVVYQGKVYALVAEARIDLDGEVAAKSACPTFVGIDQPVRYAATAAGSIAADASEVESLVERWSIETNRYGHYLVFDGTEDVAEEVVGRIQDAGLGVRRWDVSTRRTADGEQYDWFIRLGFDGSEQECATRVEEALAARDDVAMSITEANRRINELARVTAELRPMVEAALEMQQATAARTVELESELAAARTMLRRAERERDAARGRVAELDERLAGSVAGETSADAAEYRDLLLAAEEERDGLAVERDRLAVDLELQDERAQSLQAQLDHLQRGLDEASRRAVSRTATPRGGDVFERLWPRLLLHDDAKAYLVDIRTCPQPHRVGHVLSQLDRGESVPMKKFRATAHVREVNEHIRLDATGRDRGRVYVRHLSDDRLWVFIDRKGDDKQQTAYARWIDSLPEPESATL